MTRLLEEVHDCCRVWALGAVVAAGITLTGSQCCRAQAEPDPPAAASRPASPADQVGRSAPPEIVESRVQLMHLTAASLHDRLEKAFGRKMPLLGGASDGWQRFSIDTGTEAPLLVTAHERTGEVRLLGRADQVGSWRRILAALDRPAQPDGTTRAITTSQAAEAPIRDAVGKLVAGTGAQGAAGAVVPGENLLGTAAQAEAIADSLLGPVQVEFVEGTDILIIRGNPRDVERVEQVIRQIEEMTQTAPPLVRIQPLKYVDSVSMSRMLDQVFSTTTPESLARYYGVPLVLPLVRPNAVLVIGQAKAVETASQILQKLDVAVDDAAQFEVFPLSKAVAEDAEDVLEDLFIPEDDDDAPIFRPRALIIADSRSNSLIVRAGPRDMAEIRRLIGEIDRTADAAGLLKVFPISNGDATSLVETLDALFGTSSEGQQDQGGGPARTSVVQLRFSVDERTNSILAFGSSEDLVVVEAILLRLDSTDSRQRKNYVYQLKNASAEDVALAIQQALEAERDVRQTAPGVMSPFEQLEREVIVVPELASNSLIVSASPRAYDEIVRVIEDLDKEAPMVMIQVLIGELRLGDSDEFGVELGLQDSVLFDRSLLSELDTTTNVITTVQPGGAQNTVQQQIIQGANLTPGFNFGNPANGLGNSGSDLSLGTAGRVAAQGLSSFALNRVNPDLGFGGLVLSASSDSISMLLRALQQSQRLEVLSRPQIMALDGQVGTAFVGELVPLIRSSNIDQFGNPQNTIEPEQVGLLLEVQPRISPEGLVVMRVHAEKSELGRISDGVPVAIAPNGDPINQPRISQTVADTVVSAVSGQTIVLSGLLTKRDFALHRRIPLLADIPLLGELFKFDSVSTDRTELLVIMTPHVVRTRYEAEMLKQVESARMGWCLSDVVDLHGAAGLLSRNDQLGAAQAEAVYPTDVPTPAELPVEAGQYVLPSPNQPMPSAAQPSAPAAPRRAGSNLAPGP
jgi:type II secretion system protein D